MQHNGYLSLINDDVNRVDTTIILSSNIVALFIKKCYPILIEQIKIYGDVEFATQISKLGRYLRWEPEEDIASLIGDECAYRMLTLARNIGLHAHRISRNIIDSFIEYWLDENPQVVRRETYKDIVIEFSELCTALARVERKIEHLEKIGACGK
ncbi:MAG: sterol-binding protein [Burkholderia sp.]|nr:sterol-binding protein [Burkholderia sp.]